jgi:hypothetical protein
VHGPVASDEDEPALAVLAERLHPLGRPLRDEGRNARAAPPELVLDTGDEVSPDAARVRVDDEHELRRP